MSNITLKERIFPKFQFEIEDKPSSDYLRIRFKCGSYKDVCVVKRPLNKNAYNLIVSSKKDALIVAYNLSEI